MGAVRVFLLDDHELLRRGLHDLLDRRDDVTVVGEAGLAADALRDIPALLPEVALLDVQLPDGNGIEVCRQIRTDHPGVACVILTAFDDMAGQLAAITAGAAGFVLKYTSGATLVDAVRRAAAGQSLLDPAVTQAVLSQLQNGGTAAGGSVSGPDPVTAEEQQVLQLMAAGLTNRQIGSELFLPDKAVKIHVTRLLVKLGLMGGTPSAAGLSALPGAR